MAGKPKPKPIEVFESNIADAERLVLLASALHNQRKNRMRRELRDAVGNTLKLGRKRREGLDCVESDDLFVVIKPGGRLNRSCFAEGELRPLLRQSIVATAAAVEAYVAEKACSFIPSALNGDGLPPRLAAMPVAFVDMLWIEQEYDRRGWGRRRLIAEYLEHEASADPAKIGMVFSTVGVKGFWPMADKHRGVPKGNSEASLRDLAERRNRIAHTGDRSGRGRAALTVADAQRHLEQAKSVVEALEAVL
jgi:hypothetical protein